MSDRRPLGTGTDRATTSRTRGTDPVSAPRAQLAAERLPAVPAAEPTRPRPAGCGVCCSAETAGSDRGCDGRGDTGL
ncbi:hypothetical protein [Streptomyces sp. MBT33]|uniref:hypothetical protein n=1 Tax=Streptomyces sp. MBT33 TaxID=1488363 RepID=UPI00190CFF85|nr:hypothetical protein [Streptomyces sp. MBT33]MBK3647810.1 hypothetical protein [Streptomyces sp. MBT33]